MTSVTPGQLLDCRYSSRPAGYGIDGSVRAYVSADRLRINPSAVLAAEK
jgi:hypothetical protein